MATPPSSNLSPENLSRAFSLRNEDGRSILHVAAASGHSQLVSLLITHGADVDIVDKEGYTVLGPATNEFRPILVDAAKASKFISRDRKDSRTQNVNEEQFFSKTCSFLEEFRL